MNLWPLAVYVAIVGMLVVTMLSLSFAGSTAPGSGYGLALRIWHPLRRFCASADAPIVGEVPVGSDREL